MGAPTRAIFTRPVVQAAPVFKAAIFPWSPASQGFAAADSGCAQ